MTISEFRAQYPDSAIHTQFMGFFDDHGFLVTAQLTKGDDVKTCGQGRGKTVEEEEDKAIQRALDHLS